eukprot:COSAG02_NODE_55882_length_288_cov_0.809524_1_plen_61_part_10
MPTVSAGVGKTAGFLTKMLSTRTKVSVRAADPTDGEKEPELRPSTPLPSASASTVLSVEPD